MAINAGDIVWFVDADTAGLEKGLKHAGALTKKLGAAMTVIGGVITGVVGKSVKDWAAAGDEIQKMAERTGFATETLSELKFAAERSGASLNAIEKSSKKLATSLFEAGKEGEAAGAKTSASLEKLNQKINIAKLKHAELQAKVANGKASNEALAISQQKGNELLRQQAELMNGSSIATGINSDALNRLGLSYQELAGLNSEEQFLKVAIALGNLEDQTLKVALAQQLFGRSGTELMPMFNAGAEGMEQLRERARELGIVFDEEAANKAAKFQDSMLDLGESLKALKFAIGSEMAGHITKFVDKATEIVTKVKDWTKANPKLTANIIKITVAVGAAMLVLGPLLVMLPGLIAAFGLIGPIIGVVASAFLFLTGPVGLLVAAIGAAVFFIVKNWDFMKQRTMQIFTVTRDFIGRVIGAIQKRIGGFIDRVKKAIEFAIKLAKAIGKSTGLPGFASGGIVGHASGGVVGGHNMVMVGERGPELAALPSGTRIMSNTTMRSLGANPDRIAGGGGGSFAPVINVSVDGSLTGSEIVDKIKSPLLQMMAGELRQAMR